jgi:hypothetical protein
MNRATADNQSAQAEDEGLEPTKEWVKDLIDEIIAEEFASPDLELVGLSEEDHDLGKNETALESRIKLGALTLRELRDSLGLDSYANADRAMVPITAGCAPIARCRRGGLATRWRNLLERSVRIRAVAPYAASGCRKSFEFIGF